MSFSVVIRSLLLFGVCFGCVFWKWGVFSAWFAPCTGQNTHTHTHLSLLCCVSGCCGFFLPPGDQV